MPRHRKRLAMLAAAASLACGGVVRAADFEATWNTDAVGSWTNAALWSTNPTFPNNGTNTFNATIDSPAAKVILNAPISINSLTMSAGTLTGAQALTLAGSSSWLGGTITGGGTLNINSSLTIDGTDHYFTQSTLNIGAGKQVVWLNGHIHAPDPLGGGGTINNAGLWDDKTNSEYYWDYVQTPVFNNTGEYRKSDGSQGFPHSVWFAFNNSGSVNIVTSGVWFAGGGHNTGSFTVAEGAIIAFADFHEGFSAGGAPTTTFASTASINSLGTVGFLSSSIHSTTVFAGTFKSAFTVVDTDLIAEDGLENGEVSFTETSNISSVTPGDLFVRSGTLRLNTSSATVGFAQVELQAGAIRTSDDLFLGTLEWTAGAIRGETPETPPNASTGQLTFIGDSDRELADITLYNGIGSHATIDAGTISLNQARITNLAGATFDFQGSAIVRNAGLDSTGGAFNNAGLLLMSAADETAELRDVSINNDGAVRVDAGTLFLNGGGLHNGTLTVAAGATLELGAGAFQVLHDFQAGATVSGAPGSQLTIRGPVQFHVGSITHVDRLTSLYGGYIIYDGGTLTAGELRIEDGSQFLLTPGGGKTLVAKSIHIPQFSEGVLDLSDNKAIIDYDAEANPVNDIRQLIVSGHNGGGWDGEGITSSFATPSEFAVGYADNAILNLSTFGGYEIDATSILIRFTYAGDANLDGQVDIRDLYALAINYNTTGKVWTSGDYNYDGNVDVQDLTLLANNWQAGVGSPLAQSYLDFALASLGLPVMMVPEPGAMLFFAGCLFSLRRRRSPD